MNSISSIGDWHLRGQYMFPPVRGHSPVQLNTDQTILLSWVLAIFKQDPSNDLFLQHYEEFKSVKSHVESKGNYTPSRKFLDEVYKQILNGTFNAQNLQSLETSIFFSSGDSSLFSRNITAMGARTAQRMSEMKRIGVQVQVEGNPAQEARSQGKVPSLRDLAAEKLMKNGLPQAYVSKGSLTS